MRKFIVILVFSVISFVCFIGSQAQTADVKKGSWLLGVIFKLEKMRDDAAADIQRYTSEIYKCSDTIGKSENIIRLARQRSNTEAERIAGTALAKARQAKLKNEELKNAAELRKRKAEIVLANVRNLLAKQLNSKAEIRSVVTGITGRATIFSKRLNKSMPVEDTNAAFLEPGDEIWTYGNSSVEMQFLDGRGTLKLGEYSKFRMGEDSTGQQVIHMLKGKIYIAVDKLDDYRRMMKEGAEEFGEKYKEALKKLAKKTEKLEEKLGWVHLRVRSESSMGAIRGTKLVVIEHEAKETEWIVLEGVVDVKAIKGDESASVDAGYRIQASKDGVISKPVKIDLKKIKRWWKK